jgi:hypothetical protein
MHLVGPALTTTGKRKGKTKYRNSAEAQKARQLDRDWEELQRRWGVPAAKKQSKNSQEKLDYSLTAPVGRQSTKHIKSLDQGHTGPVSSPPRQQYTGTKMIGIVVQHKSCLQPVFNLEAAADSAKMRR